MRKNARLELIVISIFLIFGINLTTNVVYATSEDDSSVEASSDDEDFEDEGFECIRITEEDIAEHQQHICIESSESIEPYALSESGIAEEQCASSINWDKYGSDYCYSQLSLSEQNLYKKFNDVAKSYATSYDDVEHWYETDTSGIATIDGYYLDEADYSNLTAAEAIHTAYVFIYQNPQYFFLRNAVLYEHDSTNSSGHIYLSVFPLFSDGDERYQSAESFIQKIEGWLAEIEEVSGTLAKEKKINKIICDNVDYVSNDYDQSAYSAVILGETVCAGYTKLFSILSNGAGIDTIGVTGSVYESLDTSYGHAWNKTCIYGTWYNVDTTWNDNNNSVAYLNVSEATNINTNHYIYTYYSNLVPECPKDYVYSSGISIQENMRLAVNQISTMSATFIPSDASCNQIAWSSSDDSIATVNADGKVTCLKEGTCTITAVLDEGGFSDTCIISVDGTYIPSAPTAKSISSTEIILNSVDGCEYSRDKVSWQSSTVFAGLTPNTKYTFYVRTKASVDCGAGETSKGTTITTIPNGWVVNSDKTMSYYRDSSKVTSEWVLGSDGEKRYLNSKGNMVTNEFICDNVYTYYLQADGSPMKNRLSYHPDGVHIIYFDEYGHEVFDSFANVKKTISGQSVNDLCYFNTFGYLYVDVLTYDRNGLYQYYANPYGVMECIGWFRFSDGGLGYANSDGKLMTNVFVYDQWGRVVYLMANGHAATGTITDGYWYYVMDESDGHLINQYR